MRSAFWPLQGFFPVQVRMRILVKGQFRTADRAGDGLGMETAIRWILIFSLAIRAKRKPCHRCEGTVVRHLPNDRESGSTIRAIDERVAVPAVGGIEQLPQAIRACCHVWWNDRKGPGLDLAFQDLKTGKSILVDHFTMDLIYPCQVRGFGLNELVKILQPGRRAGSFNDHP